MHARRMPSRRNSDPSRKNADGAVDRPVPRCHPPDVGNARDARTACRGQHSTRGSTVRAHGALDVPAHAGQREAVPIFGHARAHIRTRLGGSGVTICNQMDTLLATRGVVVAKTLSNSQQGVQPLDTWASSRGRRAAWLTPPHISPATSNLRESYTSTTERIRCRNWGRGSGHCAGDRAPS